MSEMIWLIRRMFVSTFRNKASWFVYIGFPVLSVLLAMFIYSNANSGMLRIGIVDLDENHPLTQHAIDFLANSNQGDVILLDEQEMHAEIAKGNLDNGIVFEQGFGVSLRNGSPDHISIISLRGAEVTAYIKALLESYLGNVAAIGIAAGADEAQFAALFNGYEEQSFDLQSTTLADTSNAKQLTYQSVGFLVLLMMFSAANLTGMILKEKEERTFLRLLTTPMAARTYVLANVFVNFIILFLQILIAVLVLKLILRIDLAMTVDQLITALVIFSFTAIGLALMLVAFAKNRMGANALQNLIITPSCTLTGCFFPIDIMPDSVRNIANFLPQTWLLDWIDQLQQGQSFGSLYLNMIILLAFAAVFTLIAIFRFNRNDDVSQFI